MRRTIQIHRSYRKALVYPEPNEPRTAAGRKDTKRWCRGKVGVKHSPEWRPDHIAQFTVYACTTCGRHLDWCGGFHPVCKCGRHAEQRGN